MPFKVTKRVKEDNTAKLKQIISELKSKKIKVGIFGSSGSQMLIIASVNEFGCSIKITPKMRAWLHYNGLHVKDSTKQIVIPERSFLRATANGKRDLMDKFIQQNLNDLFTFKIDLNTFLNRVGQYLAQLTQQTLLTSGYKENHPFTIERKGGKSKPLVNSGRLLNSITYEIE